MNVNNHHSTVFSLLAVLGNCHRPIVSDKMTYSFHVFFNKNFCVHSVSNTFCANPLQGKAIKQTVFCNKDVTDDRL